MKKLSIGVIAIALILNLSTVLTVGLKIIDSVGTSLGLTTIEIVDKGSELIYAIEDLGL